MALRAVLASAFLLAAFPSWVVTRTHVRALQPTMTISTPGPGVSRRELLLKGCGLAVAADEMRLTTARPHLWRIVGAETIIKAGGNEW